MLEEIHAGDEADQRWEAALHGVTLRSGGGSSSSSTQGWLSFDQYARYEGSARAAAAGEAV